MRFALLFSFVLLCGCGLNPRTTAPVYDTPTSREIAARHLNEALDQGARGISEVHANVLTLSWHERLQLSDKRYTMLERELALMEVRAVQRPERDTMGWQLHIDATGGKVVFLFKDGLNASKAESALRRLMRAD